MKLAQGTREVLDAESLVTEYVSPHKRGLRYAYPYYDGLVTNNDNQTLCTGDLLAPALLGVGVGLDRMHTLTRLMPLLQRSLDALSPGIDLASADEATLDLVASLYDPLDDPSVEDRDVKGSPACEGAPPQAAITRPALRQQGAGVLPARIVRPAGPETGPELAGLHAAAAAGYAGGPAGQRRRAAEAFAARPS